MPRVVACTRPLDLDHFRAEIGEKLRTPRPRENAREV
jgi:methyl coenzyme M reductase subunit C